MVLWFSMFSSEVSKLLVLREISGAIDLAGWRVVDALLGNCPNSVLLGRMSVTNGVEIKTSGSEETTEAPV